MAISMIPSPISETVIPAHRSRKSRCRSGTRIFSRRWTNPPTWSLIGLSGLGGGPQGGAEQVASCDRLSRARQCRALGQGLLQVVERDAHDAAQPLDAAVHGLVNAARVLEERARAQAGAEHREREVEPHGDPPAVAVQGLGEGLDGVLVPAQSELIPSHQLPHVLLPLVAEPALVDHLL